MGGIWPLRGAVTLLRATLPVIVALLLMKLSPRQVIFAAVVAALAAAALVVASRFQQDLALAAERAAQGSAVVPTRCGPIEVQQAGAGIPLLMIHGSGGGHDQGMAWAGPP